jgi:hypothetical protein
LASKLPGPPAAIAAGELALILPAGVFMLALVGRHLPAPGLAFAADSLVDWYAARMWTLWLLLLLMPMGALGIGCATLFNGARPTFGIVSTTLIAAVILAIVVLHAGAN